MATATEVSINHVQAIEHVEFDMPPGQGGIRIIKGRNGAGKTTALLCVSALLGEKVTLGVSDGHDRGSIKGMGVEKVVTDKIRTKGKTDTESLTGRFNISDLVDPRLKDAAARNKARVKALVSLTSNDYGPEDFYGLFGGEDKFWDTVDAESLEGASDLLELAGKVKRATDAVAKGYEVSVEDSEARWQVAVEQSKGAKPDQPPKGVAELADAYSASKSALEQGRAQNEANETARRDNESIDAKLEQHLSFEPDYDVEETREGLARTIETVEVLRKKLEAAEASKAEYEKRVNQIDAWTARRDELASMRKPVSLSVVDVDSLESDERHALEALHNAEAAKQQWEAATRAKELSDQIKSDQDRAKKFRAIAKGTSDVVTSKLDVEGLKLVDSVLMSEHARRGKWVAFDELSEGERCRIAIAIAIQALGAGGVLVLEQEVWQSLDTATREAVRDQCCDAKVWLVSGEVGDCDLCVESEV